MTARYKLKNKIISLLIISAIFTPAVLLSTPKIIHAQTDEVRVNDTKANATLKTISAATKTSSTTDTKSWARRLAEDVLKAFARKLLAQMTQATVNWINTGFHGAPLFVENPGSFFKDIAKSEIKDLVTIIGYNNSKFPFGKSTAIGIIDDFKNKFAQNAQYSLSKVTNDRVLIDNFQTDFNVGGWDGFLLTTQFPQNNPIGFHMLVAEELAKKLKDNDPSDTDIIKQTLQQGQGFLSPQMCPADINPNYNNLQNQFKKPTFKPKPYTGSFDCSSAADEQEYASCMYQKGQDEEAQQAKDYAEWSKTNTCLKPDGTSGLVNTTPGSVVGGQIIKALGASTFDSTVLAGSLGNSLSAIFDALLNKFMSSGLNALSNKINGTGGGNNTPDDFSYDGHTLGTDTTNTTTTSTNNNFNWNGPDEVIVLDSFKQQVQAAIDAANKELLLIDNAALSTPTTNASPGVLQMFNKIWGKEQELDMCVPGPDINWQDRVDGEVERINSNLTTSIYADPATIAATENATRAAAETFKNTVLAAMKAELPSAASYINSLSAIKPINQQAVDLTEREGVLIDNLIRLNAINSELSSINTQPDPGTDAETNLIQLKQRFNAMILDISSTGTLTDTQNKLADATAKFNNLSALSTKCTTERTAKGWSIPGGAESAFSHLDTVTTEKYAFCDVFMNFGANCDTIYRANITDYKKN